MLKQKKILLVAAHPDDIESGCGGTVAKYSQQNTMHSIVFAPCLEDPLNAGIIEEFQDAMKTLGIRKAIKHNFPRDILEDHNQEIRNILHNLKAKFDPSVVFCPSSNDLHQDHRAIASCCSTIFRDSATLLSFELVRSTVDFKPNFFVVLSQLEMKKKFEALRCYRTQYRRTYFKPDIFKGLARFRGSQINCTYAEAFEITRMTDR